MFAEPSTPAVMPEKPRLVFAFGPTPDSFFVSCGQQMEWHDLPPDLDHILSNRAREVLALSLGEDDSFYCRYVTKTAKADDKTVTGNLPPRLEWLLNSWWADQYQVPHIALGPAESYFFQLPSMTTWEHIPKRLEETLLSLRDMKSFSMPPGAVTLGVNGSHILLCGASGDTTNFAGIDPELAEKLADDGSKGVEMAILSAYAEEDYVVVFKDGRIFYSLPDSILPTFEKFVRIYQDALTTWRESVPSTKACFEKSSEPGEGGRWVEEPATPGEEDIARLAERLETTPISSPESVPQMPYTPVSSIESESVEINMERQRGGRGTGGRSTSRFGRPRKPRAPRTGAFWSQGGNYCVDPRCNCRGPPPVYQGMFYR